MVKDRWILAEGLGAVYCEAFWIFLTVIVLYLFIYLFNVISCYDWHSHQYEEEGIRDYGDIFKDC